MEQAFRTTKLTVIELNLGLRMQGFIAPTFGRAGLRSDLDVAGVGEHERGEEHARLLVRLLALRTFQHLGHTVKRVSPNGGLPS